MGALKAQAVELQNIHCLGEKILASGHPDSIITLKSWISVTKTRYEEVGDCMICKFYFPQGPLTNYPAIFFRISLVEISQVTETILKLFNHVNVGEHLNMLIPKAPCFWTQVQTWAQQQGQKIEASLAALEAEREEIQRLMDWISSAEEALGLRDQEPLAESMEQNQELIEQHMV